MAAGYKGLRCDSQLGLTALRAELDKIKNTMRAELVRFSCPWDTIETSDNVFDWSHQDNCVNEAKARGLKIVFHIIQSPTWTGTSGGWDPPIHNTTQLNYWKDFCQALATRYGTDVDIYEVWNEPNGAGFWQPGTAQSTWPGQYADLLRYAYTGLKAGNAAVTVAGMNPARPGALGYIGKVYDALEAAVGVPTCQANNYYFDVLSLHPYCLTHSPSVAQGTDDITDSWGVLGRCFLDYRRSRDLVHTREGVFKDVYMGEFGYNTDGSTNNGPVADSVRAGYVTTAFNLIRADGFVIGLTWYAFDQSSAAWDIDGTLSGDSFAAIDPTGPGGGAGSGGATASGAFALRKAAGGSTLRGGDTLRGAAASGTSRIRGGGFATSAVRKAVSGSSSVRGGGSVTSVGSRVRVGTSTVRGGGSLTAATRKGAIAASTVRGGGSVTSVGAQDRPAFSDVSTVRGGGFVTSTVRKSASNVSTVRGGGSLTATARKAAAGASSITGGGGSVGVGREGSLTAGGVSGGGSVNSAVRKSASGSSSVRGGGGLTSTYSRLEFHVGTSNVRGGGAVTSSVRKGALLVSTVRGGGSLAGVGRKGALASSSTAGGGSVTSSGFPMFPRFGTSSVRGGGAIAGLARTGRTGLSSATGSGRVTSSYAVGHAGTSRISGGGSLTATTTAVTPAVPAITSRTRSSPRRGRFRVTTGSGRTLSGVASGRTRRGA